jgi:uncharacterized protein (DUF2235 family)
MAQNLTLFLDGTWNSPKTNTNVWKGAKQYVATKGKDGRTQRVFYDKGVGGERFTWIRGGAFGRGLSKNVRQAYEYISTNYSDGDGIYIFGFSRGAYTARSVSGMIVRYGLIRPNAELDTEKLFDIYQGKIKARRITTLDRLSPADKANITDIEKLILKHSRRVPIQFMGLWDTVGMVGLPRKGKVDKNSFHHRGVSSLFENVAHALSLDEHRKFYKPTMFCKYVPAGEDVEKTKKAMKKLSNRIEQRWFSGCHGDVGGSKNDHTGSLPLDWILQQAEKSGLGLRKSVPLSGNEPQAPIFDSWGKAALGLYRTRLLGGRHYRPLGRDPETNAEFSLHCLNEKIDKSVFDRWRHDSKYRPENLAQWARDKGLDPATIKKDHTA